MGNFSYPAGMAATKRIQNIIKSLSGFPEKKAIQVILQRQSSKENLLSGIHEGIPYKTITSDLFRMKMFFMLPFLYYKTVAALKTAFRHDCKNIIYYYGPIFFDSIVPLFYAKKLGYKIVFDVNEDFNLATGLSHSLYSHVKLHFLKLFSIITFKISSGFVAISSYLEDICKSRANGKIPVHYMPISVDMDLFPRVSVETKPSICLFYAGSFAVKDGLPILLDAFEVLAAKHTNVSLFLSGRGGGADMDNFYSRLEISPYKNRIHYKGYLAEKNYYSLLNSMDILCMTRLNTAFSNAGFPFKLGEYLATGNPVIASRVSDVERFLSDKKNAILVQPGSIREICDAIDWIIDNPELVKSMGAKGRKVAENFFDYKLQGKTLIEFLKLV